MMPLENPSNAAPIAPCGYVRVLCPAGFGNHLGVISWPLEYLQPPASPVWRGQVELCVAFA